MRETLVNTVELRRRLGQRHSLAREVTLEDIAVGSTFVPADRPIRLVLEAEAVADGLVVDGTISADWEGECRRCLEPVEGTVTVEVHELYTEGGDPDETYPIENDSLDLAPLARDALMLNLPQLPLCGDDCAGPDPDRYPARPARDEAPLDPRWAALSDLHLDN